MQRRSGEWVVYAETLCLTYIQQSEERERERERKREREKERERERGGEVERKRGKNNNTDRISLYKSLPQIIAGPVGC